MGISRRCSIDTDIAASRTARTRTTRAGIAVLAAGVAVLAAGALIFVGSLGIAAADWIWPLMLLGFLGMVYGMPGVHEYQAPADGALGRWGALLVRSGGALIVILGVVFLVWEAVGNPPEEGPGVVDAAWMIGFAAFAIGVILFGIGVLRAKVLPAASGVLMLVGLVAAISIDMATGAFFDTSTATEWGFYIGVPLFALGLIWAGYTVWKDRGSSSWTGGITAVP